MVILPYNKCICFDLLIVFIFCSCINVSVLEIIYNCCFLITMQYQIDVETVYNDSIVLSFTYMYFTRCHYSICRINIAI